MKLAFLPIDNRPVCYSLAKDIANIDNDIELFLPPREFLGDLTKIAQIDKIIEWLKALKDIDILILSLDTLVYGGLIPSRRSEETFEELKQRLNIIKSILKDKKVLAFSSIMRISNNNYNEEEKLYWKDYGTKIFEYSYSGGKINNGIPEEILKDYLNTRKRNFEINKIFLDWQKEGIFDTLIFSKDDCAEFGFNVKEAFELEKLGGKTKTGADEIPLTLLARAIDKDLKIYPMYVEENFKDCISNYEDVSIEKSVKGQLELANIKIVDNEYDADVILLVNNFIEKQGEHVMGWDTKNLDKILNFPQKPFAVADVRFANGGENEFVEQLLNNLDLNKFYGYSGWNTSANSLGSLLAELKIKWNAKNYNDENFKKLQAIRFLDDWAYQANVRKLIDVPCDIKNLMLKYEQRISKILGYEFSAKYSYPWNRKFEIEIIIN